ncbi:hypothetical protein MMC08_009136, partial [Hypocenomyce scalaris]|nr:hypothetical protein [Hypocenomyce scalaris]
MWGTENPPGAEDPYGGPSKLEQRRDNRKKDLVAVAEGAPDAETVLPDDGASNYVPATTWDGLEHIGGASGWWEEAWDQEHPFYGFMAPSKMTSREEIEAAVRRAVIEVFTLQDAERQLADAVNALDDKVIPDFENVTISQSDDGSVVLNFLDTHVREDILQSTDLSRRGPAEEVMETQDEYEAASTKGITEVDAVHATPVGQIMPEKESTAQQTGEFHPPASTSAESGWGDVSIRDTDLKFAVLKRVMQLTGTRIPDHAIEDINTAKALIGHLVKKPKPKKLAESLLVNEKLTA